MIKLLFSFWGAILMLLSICCSNALNNNDINSLKVTDTLQPNKIYSLIYCKADARLSYAIYLPTNYNKVQKYPLMVYFDPQGDAVLPITKYAHLSDQYEFVMIGINNSKNGLPINEIKEAYKTVITEVTNLFNIEQERIILAGFSGGARIAGVLGLTEPNIFGVVACGAGFPENVNNIPNNFKYFGLVGNQDFNYLEMLHSDTLLNHLNVDHFVYSFEGRHEWPNEAVFKEAIIWMYTRFFSHVKIDDKTNLLISNFEKRINDSIASAISKKLKYEEYQYLKQKIFYLKPFRNTKEWMQSLNALENCSEIKSKNQLFHKLADYEIKKQQVFFTAFSQKNAAWWNLQMKTLIKSRNSKKKTLEVLVNMRLLSFLSLVSYMNANKATEQNDTVQANLFLHIYRTVDPENPEHSYLQARLLAKNGYYEKAIQYLEESINLGFKDRLRLNEDALLMPLKENPKYTTLLLKIEVNNRKN